MNEPRYQLPPLTLGQLEKVAFALDSVAAGEADPNAEVFQLLDLVRKTRVDALKFKQRNCDRAVEVMARQAAKKWRHSNQEYRGGVVLVFEGAAYGWKNTLRDADHERPGVYAVDDQERIFIAQGGDEHNGAERWVAAEQLQSSDGVNT